MPLGANKAAIMGVAGTAAAGDVVLLYDNDFTDETTISITSGIDSTYGEYIFKFYNINPATDDVEFGFQANATDGADYNDSAITSTAFVGYHKEDDSAANVNYEAGHDLAQDTTFQTIAFDQGNGGDESCAGELHLFNPSSTTYVKQWYARSNGYAQSDMTQDFFTAGYFNDTTAIDDIQFKMSSGNFDGTIKMWGVK